MDKDIEVRRPIEGSIVGHSDGMMTTAMFQAQWDNLRLFIKNNLRPDVDYGEGGGKGSKKALRRPGAEKILKFFGLGCRLVPTKDRTVMDWAKPFFAFDYSCEVFRVSDGKLIAIADGSANSMEDRFRWQWIAEKKLPRGTNTEALEREERDGAYGPYTVFRCPVVDPYSQVNNIQKRAGKRAMVAAVLIACAASDYFEARDEDEDGEDSHAPRQKGGERATDPSGYAEKYKISEPRLKRLFAIKSKCGKDDATVLAEVEAKYAYLLVDGKPDFSRLSFRHYDAFCNWLEGKA